MSKFEEEIAKLTKRASNEHSSIDALRFSQAALNLANVASTAMNTAHLKKTL